MKSGVSGHDASGEDLRFGEFRLDLRQSALFRGDTEVKLRPKAFDALKHFAANPGRLIAKSELLATLWPGMTAVSEDSLAHCIMEVRRALGDSQQSLLKTVTGRGYIFAFPEAAASPVPPPAKERSDWKPYAWAALAVLTLAISYAAWRQWTSSAALALIPIIENLSAQGDYVRAFDLSEQVLAAKPGEPRIQRLLNSYSDDLSVKTDPPGAAVSLHIFGESQERSLGSTPLERVRIPRGSHVLRIRKAGFATWERSITSSVERSLPSNEKPWDLRVEWKLIPESEALPGMVLVPATKHYPMRMLRAAAKLPVSLAAYHIDRREVSNRDFQDFVNSGAFQKASEGKDKSGLPGPRNWNGGKPPDERLDHPVTGVNWREAKAYCQWRGKDLPTLYQWQAAARPRYYTPYGSIYPWGIFQASEVALRANLQSQGTWPAASQPFGMSHVGAMDMAGNVREWLLNEWAPGRAIGGGSWRDDVYQFLVQGSAEETRVADDLGFRCALGEDREGAARIEYAEAPKMPSPPTEKKFQEIAAQYSYEARSTKSEVVRVREGPTWRREEIRFGAANGELTYGYLYLPKNAQPPYQTIQLLGGTGFFLGLPLTESVEGRQTKLEPFISAGRALFVVALQGFQGRPPVGEIARLSSGSQRHRELLRDWLEDLRRGIDYLETRPDIDAKRIVFWNNSTTEVGVMTAALEPRYAAAIYCGAGFEPNSLRLADDINPGIFAPFIRAPKLLLHGKYDEQNPVPTMGRPVYDAMRGDKKWILFDGGHIAPPEVSVPAILPWLDEKLGKVRR